MGYIVILRNRSDNLIMDYPFDSAEDFDAWYEKFKHLYELVARGVTPEAVSSHISSFEEVLSFLTPRDVKS